MTYDLNQKVVLLTGSTGGLGRAIGQSLRAKGAKLALLDIDYQAAAEQAQVLGDPGVVQAWQVDVRCSQSVETAIAAAAQHFGGIDVVIANAGIDVIASMESMSPEAFDRVIDINLNGVWRTFRAALPHVCERKGYLLAISSMAAFVHSPLQAHYTASKAGVWAMCNSIRLELRHQGVGVGSIHPTFFQTPLVSDLHASAAGRKLWGGNAKGIWKMVSLDEVVTETVRGIEQRADMVVIPRRNRFVARAPGLLRKLIERIGFDDTNVAESVRLANTN